MRRPGIETPWRKITFEYFVVDEPADGLDCLVAVRLLGEFRETYEEYFKPVHEHGEWEMEQLLRDLREEV